MEPAEGLKEVYSRAKVVTEGGEDLLSCRPLFSNDQRWLFVACGCHVKVISLSSREVVHTLNHHAKPITVLAFNPRNQMQLVTVSLDGLLILWDYTDGALLRVIDFSAPLFKFRFRPGNQEPSVFFLLQKDEADYVVVGVSSHVITGRESSTAPSDQLADAQHYLSTKKPNNFAFTYDGSCLITFSGKKLLVCDLENESNYSYRSSHTITTVDCHPMKPCIATGNTRGEIHLWYDFARSDTKVVVTTFHWHAHGVADVCFTFDGSYLLSGGEESVLVLWQLDSHKKQFRPRLGAPITKLACCHGDTHFAVSLQSNVICLLSGLDTEVEHTVGGLRKAYMQDPRQSGLRIGLVWCPRSNSLLLNSTPGFLQFYDPFTDTVTKEMDIAYLNIVSRPDDKPLELTTVEHAAFSPDGVWLATVETRNDKKTAPELKMKLWEFSPAYQRYILNTCVDPPHDDKVTGLTFQPSWKRHMSESGHSLVVHMAVTTSLDGRFKSWVLVDEGREEREEQEGRKGKRVGPSWACRSVGYYHNMPCLGATFSQDGSLLALNFKKYVTIWDPFSYDLLKTLNAPLICEQFVHITFGSHSSSQYLLASTTTHLLVWNMLTCTMQWCIKASVNHLVSDPFSSVAVVFVSSDTKSSNMYIFSPSCSTPLALHEGVCTEEVVGAVFVRGKFSSETRSTSDHLYHGMMKSRLYFMDKKQVLYSLKWDDDEEESDRGRQPSTNFVETMSKRAFTEIFGDTERSTKPTREGSAVTYQALKSQCLLNGAPHVLPPMNILCQHYLKALLPSSQTELTGAAPTFVVTSDDEVDSGDASSNDEVEGHQSGQLVPQKRQLSRGVEDSHVPRTISSIDYNWLTNCFKPL